MSERKVTPVILSYDQLRRVVLALFNQGRILKGTGLTYSHSNLGNEYQELAKLIDHELTMGMESKDQVVIMSVKDNQAIIDSRREGHQTLLHWQNFAERLSTILRCGGMDDDIERAVKNLVAKNKSRSKKK